MFSNGRVEAFGFACVLGFLGLVWLPLALLGAGLLAIVWANTRPEREGRFSRAAFAAVGASLAAARDAWRAVAQEDQGDGATAASDAEAVTP